VLYSIFVLDLKLIRWETEAPVGPKQPLYGGAEGATISASR